MQIHILVTNFSVDVFDKYDSFNRTDKETFSHLAKSEHVRETACTSLQYENNDNLVL